MTKRLFLNAFLIGIFVLLTSNVILYIDQYYASREKTYQALQQEAFYVEKALMLSGESYLNELDTTNRITWIDQQGEVLFDNLFTLPMDSQKDFQEVKDAFAKGAGRSIRRSVSSGKMTMYYALCCQDGSLIRLAHTLNATQDAIDAIQPSIFVLLISTLFAAFLSLRFARQIVKPINAIDPDHPIMTVYPELTPLINRLNEQKHTISQQMDELYRRQKEFKALTDNMNEGFVLIDMDGMIMHANNSAMNLFSGMQVGDSIHPYLNDYTKMSVAAALKGERNHVIYEQFGLSLEMIGSPVLIHDEISGAALLIVDVTEREQREQLRRSFTANVSHELKTPLTSISGFAELMANGVVEDDKIKEFAGDIYHESQRMIKLVTDIIKLSQLDEGAQLEHEEVDLYEVAQAVLDSLRSVALEHNVSLAFEGESCKVNGVWVILHEMIYNLCDNAIKYNKPQGSVKVVVKQEQTGAVVRVSDTGIGIPYIHQNAVFERFYRVDKSHSKAIGGTGLGLSIVKHGAMMHHAKIEMESEPQVGTTISIIFTQNSEDS